MPEQPADETKIDITFPEAYKLYEDGKHRRYELLFAVIGGAFAIAKLFGEKPGLGSLRLSYVALGMVLFTITMVYDIYQFGKSGMPSESDSSATIRTNCTQSLAIPAAESSSSSAR